MAGDKFIPQLLFRQLGFTYSACGPFTKRHETPNLNLNYIYKNKSDKPCLANDAAYGNRNNSAKRTISDKFLKDKTYEFAINPKYNEYQRLLPG